MYKFFNLQQNKNGFTIFELSIGITIFATLMIAILASVEYISVARQKVRIAYFFFKSYTSLVNNLLELLLTEEHLTMKNIGTV